MRGFLAFLFIGLVALGAGAVGYQAGLHRRWRRRRRPAAPRSSIGGGWHFGGLSCAFMFLLFPLFLFGFVRASWPSCSGRAGAWAATARWA